MFWFLLFTIQETSIQSHLMQTTTEKLVKFLVTIHKDHSNMKKKSLFQQSQNKAMNLMVGSQEQLVAIKLKLEKNIQTQQTLHSLLIGQQEQANISLNTICKILTKPITIQKQTMLHTKQ